jgi:hypothetical protein
MAANKYEVVKPSVLRTGDKLIVVELLTGVTRTVDVRYASSYGDGIDYTDVLTGHRGSYSMTGSKAGNYVIVRAVVQKPKNWPPKKDDVWQIGDYTWHMLYGGMWRVGGGTDSRDAEVLLNEAAGKAELLFRLEK